MLRRIGQAVGYSVKVRTRNNTYTVEERAGKFYCVESTSKLNPWLTNAECSRPVIGEPLVIISSDPDNQVITSRVRSIEP